MKYKIIITEVANEDIIDVLNYIYYVLKSEGASRSLKNKIINAIEPLSRSPEMYMKVLKTNGTQTKYRRIVIKNYILLYTIDYKEKVVYISRFYYGKSNYLKLI